MTGGAEGLKIVRIRIRSHINLNFILQQSLTAFGGAPFTQGSLSRYHVFGLLDKPGLEDLPLLYTCYLTTFWGNCKGKGTERENFLQAVT